MAQSPFNFDRQAPESRTVDPAVWRDLIDTVKMINDDYQITPYALSKMLPFTSSAIYGALRGQFNPTEAMINNIHKVAESLMDGKSKREIEAEFAKTVAISTSPPPKRGGKMVAGSVLDALGHVQLMLTSAETHIKEAMESATPLVEPGLKILLTKVQDAKKLTNVG